MSCAFARLDPFIKFALVESDSPGADPNRFRKFPGIYHAVHGGPAEAGALNYLR
jgi:hypothetical protein